MGASDNTGSERDRTKKNTFENRILILHNDDVNTFDYVIECLQEVCDHDEIQAEQCAILTHIKGCCEIKVGDLISLEKLRKKLENKSLTVTIDTLV